MTNKIESRSAFFAGFRANRSGVVRLVCRLAMIAALAAGLSATAHATGTIAVNTTLQRSAATSGLCSLGGAIITANTNTSTDGCTISGTATAPYTINVPAGTYTLDQVDNIGSFGQPFGLPGIQADITIAGAGAATTIIERSSANGIPLFGFFDNRQNSGHLTLNDLTLRNGRQASGGAAVSNNGGPTAGGPDALTVNRCVFDGNSAMVSGNGGAIAGGGTINDSTFGNNTAAAQGGAIIGPTIVSNSLFTGNQAGTGGGALACPGSGCSIQTTDSTFDSNSTAQGPGGAIDASSSAILRSVFQNNSANDVNSSGGAVSAGGGSIADSYFLNNTVNGSNGGGGGAVVGANLTITGTTFQGNQISGSGGAFQGRDSTIINSTFVGNRADPNGGAIDSAGGLTLNNVTIFGNKADSKGGGIAGSGDSVRNSIIAGNHEGSATPNADCSGSLTSQGHNLIGGGGCSVTAASGDQIGTNSAPIDPVLGRPAANGGKKAGQNGGTDILTLAVLFSSPALDAGDLSAPGSGGTSCAATDQRGITRPVGSACDIGAFEAKLGGEDSSYDLSVTNTPSTTNAVVGSNLTFTVTVANSNSDTAIAVFLSEGIDPFKFVSLTAPAGWSCLTPAVGATGLVTCTKPSLAPNNSSTFSVVVQPDAQNVGQVPTSTAGVTSSGNDTDLTNNSSTTPKILIIDPPTDLSLTMTGSPSSVNVGDNVTYTITVKNNGPKDTDRAVVADTLPANVVVVSTTSSQGTPCGTSGNAMNCFLGALANGATATVTIVLSPKPGAVPSITNSALVDAAEIDPIPGNNSASVTTTVNPAVSPDFNFSVSSPSATVAQGGKASYPVTLTPSGGFTGSVQLTCTGLPAESSCSSVPSPVSVSGNNPVQATLVIQTTAPITSGFGLPAAGNWNTPGSWPAMNLAAILGLMIAFLSTARLVRSRAWRIRYVSLAFALGLFLCVGCGGKSTTIVDNGTPKGSYTITVTATSGQTSHKSTITVVVGP